MRLGAQRVRKNPRAPVNFASTTSPSVTGEVKSTSIVPLRRSSGKRRIAMIGMTKRLNQEVNPLAKRNRGAGSWGAEGWYRTARMTEKTYPLSPRKAARMPYGGGKKK